MLVPGKISDPRRGDNTDATSWGVKFHNNEPDFQSDEKWWERVLLSERAHRGEEIVPSDDDEETDEAMIDISLDRCAQGYGLASQIILLGLRIMKCKWGKEINAVAEILKENKPSRAAFQRAGFSEVVEKACDKQLNTFVRLRRTNE